LGQSTRRALNPPHRVQEGGCLALPFVIGYRRATTLALAGEAAYLGGTQVQPVSQNTDSKFREPIFNVPAVVVGTVAVLVGVHAFRVLVLTPAEDTRFLLTFAFIPARYGTDPMVQASLPGGFGADLWTFFTYAFLHADLLHIGLNLAWLVPFATALARRFGAWRYVLFMLVTAAAGAFAQLISDPGTQVPMIGASAAISGAMAAALRFVFQPNGPLESWRDGAGDGEAYRVAAMSLLATFRDIRFLLFLVAWIGLNALFGLGAVSFGLEPGQQVAWQAHIGGFLAGLLLFTPFDRASSRRELDTEPTT
jgi:membrane associated rhomboid family serine protease